MIDPMRFDEGVYKAAGQPPVIVVDGNGLPDGMHGPWIKWRFPWDSEDNVTSSTVWDFAEMVSQAGYVLENVMEAGK